MLHGLEQHGLEIGIPGDQGQGIYDRIVDHIHALHRHPHIHIAGADHRLKALVFHRLHQLLRGILVQEDLAHLDVAIILEHIPDLFQIHLELLSEHIGPIHEQSDLLSALLLL